MDCIIELQSSAELHNSKCLRNRGLTLSFVSTLSRGCILILVALFAFAHAIFLVAYFVQLLLLICIITSAWELS